MMIPKKPEINMDWRTGMPNEAPALQPYMPIKVNHEDNAWWPDNWHEETTPVAADPPYVTAGWRKTNLPPKVQMAYGPNPNFRKPPFNSYRSL